MPGPGERMPRMGPLAVMPVSYRKPGYTWMPPCVFGPPTAFLSGDFLRTQARFALSLPARQHCGIEIACQRIRDDAVGNSVFRIALLEECICDQRTVIVGDGLRNDWFAICVLWHDLVERDGNPLADRQVGKASAHCRIARDDSVKDRGVTLRKNHAFAAPGGTSREVGKSCRFSVVLHDELFGQRSDLSIGEICKVQIRLLIFHETEVEWSPVALMACIRTNHREPAHECGCVCCCIQTKWGHHHSVSTTPTLHQKIAIPFLRHRSR